MSIMNLIKCCFSRTASKTEQTSSLCQSSTSGKIKRADFEEFIVKWTDGVWEDVPKYRFGQAFMNYFKITEHNPELFYTQSTDKAIYIIEAKYIDQTQKTEF